ncbi:hypothetical protein SLE2022_048430 [Rubroshorea leprosula]
MKLKKKIYPSPSPSSSSSAVSATGDDNYLSVLKLLPAAILALASVLSLEDREVLAYMITRSLKTTTANPSLIAQDSRKKSAKKSHPPPPMSGSTGNSKGKARHKPPVFDCDCFDCYTSYWHRWDSSANRERIHQVIEAFEEHLTNGETQKSKNTRARKGRRSADNLPLQVPADAERYIPISAISSPEQPPPAPLVVDAPLPEKATEEKASEVAHMTGEFHVAAEEEAAGVLAVAATATANNHKGLARKVLPDVLGLFNSRLWNLWNPNV